MLGNSEIMRKLFNLLVGEKIEAGGRRGREVPGVIIWCGLVQKRGKYASIFISKFEKFVKNTIFLKKVKCEVSDRTNL